MTPDEQVDLLDTKRDQFLQENRGEPGVLRIWRAMFRQCPKAVWEAHDWKPTGTDLVGLKSAHDGRRSEALLSLLGPELVSLIEFVDEPYVLEFVVPDDEAG